MPCYASGLAPRAVSSRKPCRQVISKQIRIPGFAHAVLDAAYVSVVKYFCVKFNLEMRNTINYFFRVCVCCN